jgi:FkbM family methyltransferase
MSSRLKGAIRGLLRFYLTYTPIKKGRYPLMSLVHDFASEAVTVRVKTKDRGVMIFDIADSVQFPLYYNIYEWMDQPTIESLMKACIAVVDVGANIGQLTMLFAQTIPHVYAFEPFPGKAERIREQLRLNDLEGRVFVSEKALSNLSGRLRFESPPTSNEGTGSLIAGNNRDGAIVEVEAVRLDDEIQQHGWTNIGLVKMDIEGAELFALQGMERLLATEHPILIVEMNAKMMGFAGYTEATLIAYLQEFGYECYSFTKNGLKGPLTSVHAMVENYCFLTNAHLELQKVKSVLA